TLHGWPLVSAPPHSLVGLDCLSGFCMFRSHTWTFRDLRHVSLPSADSTRISTIISALENGEPFQNHVCCGIDSFHTWRVDSRLQKAKSTSVDCLAAAGRLRLTPCLASKLAATKG